MKSTLPPPPTRPSEPAARDTLWQRLTRGARRLWTRADWHDFAGDGWADHIMNVELNDDFHAKQGRSTGRWTLERDDGRRLTVYLKRHYRLSWWRGLLATTWPRKGWSSAIRECRHLRWAIARGLPVPAPVAAGEFIGPWGRLQSFLAVEELTGMVALHQAIPLAGEHLDAASFASWKRGLTAEVARLARELHGRRFFHRDLYLCHFFIDRARVTQVPNSWHGTVWMIDFHRLARHRWFPRFGQLKDLAQLLYSSDLPVITERDRLRFWRCYMGAARRTWLNRLLAWAIRLKGRRYRNHNTKRTAE